ncbi:MAG: hypothetical protein ACPGUD_12195 [Parashewanella sp.]
MKFKLVISMYVLIVFFGLLYVKPSYMIDVIVAALIAMGLGIYFLFKK